MMDILFQCTLLRTDEDGIRHRDNFPLHALHTDRQKFKEFSGTFCVLSGAPSSRFDVTELLCMQS